MHCKLYIHTPTPQLPSQPNSVTVPWPVPNYTAWWQKYTAVITLCLKNDTDVAHYNFDADQPILIIFGRNVADRVRYQTVICYPTCPN